MFIGPILMEVDLNVPTGSVPDYVLANVLYAYSYLLV